jgi:hypothetical protein
MIRKFGGTTGIDSQLQGLDIGLGASGNSKLDLSAYAKLNMNQNTYYPIGYSETDNGMWYNNPSWTGAQLFNASGTLIRSITKPSGWVACHATNNYIMWTYGGNQTGYITDKQGTVLYTLSFGVQAANCYVNETQQIITIMDSSTYHVSIRAFNNTVLATYNNAAPIYAVIPVNKGFLYLIGANAFYFDKDTTVQYYQYPTLITNTLKTI